MNLFNKLDKSTSALMEIYTDLQEVRAEVAEQPAARVRGDISGKLAVLRMSLANMLNTHDEIELDHSNYLGVYELCCEIQNELYGGEE